MKIILTHLKSEWYKYGLETLVVIVGVLIAFALNDWNESRKERIEETRVLAEIQDVLSNDIGELEINISDFVVTKKRMKKLLSLLKQGYGDKADSIDVLFGSAYGLNAFYLNTAPFETLKSKGLETISHDSIRFLMIKVYDTWQSFL